MKKTCFYVAIAALLALTDCSRQETETPKVENTPDNLVGTWAQECENGDVVCFHENGCFYSLYFPELCGKEYRLSGDTLSFFDNQNPEHQSVICRLKVGDGEEDGVPQLRVDEIIQRFWPMSGSQYRPACNELKYIQQSETMTVSTPQMASEIAGSWKRMESAFHYSEGQGDWGDTLLFNSDGTFHSWFGQGDYWIENGIVFFDHGYISPLQSRLTMMSYRSQNYLLCYLTDPTTLPCVIEPMIYVKISE